jgi:hypothetical protein
MVEILRMHLWIGFNIIKRTRNKVKSFEYPGRVGAGEVFEGMAEGLLLINWLVLIVINSI